MVKEIKHAGKKAYQCEKCKFIYSDKSWAKKCEAWCSKNNSCNIEITKYVIKK